jgi:hypothetical protein
MSTKVYDFWKLKEKYNDMEHMQKMNKKIKEIWIKYVENNLSKLAPEEFEQGKNRFHIIHEIDVWKFYDVCI